MSIDLFDILLENIAEHELFPGELVSLLCLVPFDVQTVDILEVAITSNDRPACLANGASDQDVPEVDLLAGRFKLAVDKRGLTSSRRSEWKVISPIQLLD
ncbi:hypothetical protein HAPAU_33480 [Halalkalicoccus paucihalophilus]|uniref:Uncharacterized protein n=1 Tax=Halalkalicoccus paucihalophilus TaxID=1008153 RepID=A0A151A9Q3_9EURY|nr:hypothetical protein HAPAU_33480 [Halalkalicoccus paucihalophilus]